LGLPKFVTEEDNIQLTQPLTLYEIKNAIWGIDHLKTLGSDGFGVSFFQKYWLTIKDDMIACILCQ